MSFFLFDPKRIEDLAEARKAFRIKRTDKTRENYLAAWRALRNPFFEAVFAEFKSGDRSHVDILVTFLEEDPVFQSTGYMKEYIVQKLEPRDLDNSLTERLRAVCVRAVDSCYRREFRRYCRLAARIADKTMVEEIEEMYETGKPEVRRRAEMMLMTVARHGSPGLTNIDITGPSYPKWMQRIVLPIPRLP